MNDIRIVSVLLRTELVVTVLLMVVVVGVKLTAICLRAVDRRVAAAATIFK